MQKRTVGTEAEAAPEPVEAPVQPIGSQTSPGLVQRIAEMVGLEWLYGEEAVSIHPHAIVNDEPDLSNARIVEEPEVQHATDIRNRRTPVDASLERGTRGKRSH